jgi:serine/threonine-protein kinase
MVQIALGARDDALRWMERAYAERRGWVVYLSVNPVFDPLRGDPAFRDLVRRMRLPE